MVRKKGSRMMSQVFSVCKDFSLLSPEAIMSRTTQLPSSKYQQVASESLCFPQPLTKVYKDNA